MEREARLHLWNQLGESTEDMMEHNQDQDQYQQVRQLRSLVSVEVVCFILSYIHCLIIFLF